MLAKNFMILTLTKWGETTRVDFETREAAEQLFNMPVLPTHVYSELIDITGAEDVVLATRDTGRRNFGT